MDNIKFVIYQCVSTKDDKEKILYHEFNTIDAANAALAKIGEHFSDDFFVSYYTTTNGFNGFEVDTEQKQYNYYIDKQ